MLLHLNVEEMISLTTAWATHPEAKAIFLSIAEIAPLHSKIVEANAELLAMQPVDHALSMQMQSVASRARKVDMLHDALTRAVVSGIEADRMYCLAARPPQPKRAELLARVRAALVPRGLSVVNASYLAEAGNTARVAELLRNEPALAELLASIPIRGAGDLLELTQRWIAAGRQLSLLEHQRNVLAAQDATRPGGPVSVAAARSRWLRLVSQVLSNLELSEASPEAIETIRGPVRRASERAGLRHAEREHAERERDEADDDPDDDPYESLDSEEVTERVRRVVREGGSMASAAGS
ncbi:MAG: hypothetical protein AAGF11_49680 [Myxococcota bacterium]